MSDIRSAERLRAAATRLREVAEAATPGPWIATRDPLGRHVETGDGMGRIALGVGQDRPDRGRRVDDAAYIATMSPPVALALADLLDSTANDVEHVHDPIYNLTSTTVSRALAVADAVLGGEGR